jgi:hypothetical protein
MASPNAARSPWVGKEISWWLEHKTSERLLVVLTDGELAYADDPEADAHAALPPALRGAFTAEPRWVDLRWLHRTDHVAQSNPRLRDGIADIAAAVRDVPKDVLVGEHIRQHRRPARGGSSTAGDARCTGRAQSCFGHPPLHARRDTRAFGPVPGGST